MVDQAFKAEYDRKEQKLKRQILEAQWHGGQVRIGPEPNQITPVYPGMKKIATVIPIRWTETPQEGRPATVECVIDGKTHDHVIEPEIQQIDRVTRRPLSKYKQIAEDFAVWKWHSARGTPPSESSYDLGHPAFKQNWYLEPGHQAPTFQWDEPEPKRRGRPPKEAA